MIDLTNRTYTSFVRIVIGVTDVFLLALLRTQFVTYELCLHDVNLSILFVCLFEIHS